MWRKIGRVFGAMLGWGAVLAYILFASHLAQTHRAEQKVEKIIVSMPDSAETRRFASSEQMRKHLQRSSLKIEKQLVDSVDAVKISEYISRNGFVRDADVYVTYSGEVHIDIRQHQPVTRLMCGGLNSYITEEGELFRSPKGAAYYTSVVTGCYTPRFPRNYEGDAIGYYDELIEKENDKLGKLGGEFALLKRKQGECNKTKSKLKKDSRKPKWRSQDKHNRLMVSISKEMKECDAEILALKGKREQLKKRQQLIEQRKRKLYERRGDFSQLIDFVAEVGGDSFWSAEVVQFVADTTSTGEISMRLVPRSGNFIIEFGTLANYEEKLEKLRKFYDKGLSHIGWEHYRVVDVRYDKQVICTK